MTNFKLIYFVLFGLLIVPLWAEQSVTLPDLKRPSLMEADEDHLYIVDDHNVLIYSLKDFKLVKKFGGKGEGPQEFKIITSISLSSDQLLVNSRGKISFYSKTGIFLKEIKVTRGSDFMRMGDQFIGLDMHVVDKVSRVTINLYDAALKKIKEISRHKGLFLGSKHLDPILIYAPLGPEYMVMDTKLVVKSGGVLKIITPATRAKGSIISLESEKVPLTTAHKQEILDFYRTNFRTRNNFPALKKKFKFPDYFPAVRNYHVDGNRIYILTFRERKEEKEMLVYDRKRRFLKRFFLPLSQAHILQLFPYTIKNNTLYQLTEGEEDWQLTVKPLIL